MIWFPSLLAIAALAVPASPPSAAVALLSALESGDMSAAGATLAEDVVIMDSSTGSGVQSSLAALADFVRGCERTDLTWEYDAEDHERAAVTVSWTCPSREPSQAFVWTARSGVVHIQFGLPLPQPGQ